MDWLLLMTALPTTSASARVKLWRTIKALGCGFIGDGAYLLPAVAAHEASFDELAGQVKTEGGQAWVLRVAGRHTNDDKAMRQLFSRTEPYEAFTAELVQVRPTLGRLSAVELNRTLRRLRRTFDSLVEIDYFPNEASARAEAAWADFQEAATAVLSPGEPHAHAGAIERRNTRDYQGRLWATRRHLWVDRVASAWLIRRFIDPKARFVWIESPAKCPKDVLGFDFDGAMFTHVGSRVTFEVLMTSFGLEDDQGLARLAAMVHALDVGGAVPAEAKGFEAILSGARQRLADDDALLADMTAVLDSLHTHFSEDRTL